MAKTMWTPDHQSHVWALPNNDNALENKAVHKDMFWDIIKCAIGNGGNSKNSWVVDFKMIMK